MSTRTLIRRWAVCAAVLAIVLRSGVPLLAAGAAQWRGVPVAEVCEVYGVALPGAAHANHPGHVHHVDGHAGHGAHDGAHDDEHCALTALGALALSTATATPPPPGDAPAGILRGSGRFGVLRDASARWAARLQHGPPDLA